MTSDEAVIAVIEALNTLAVPYMLVGSLSSNYYGTSRSTRDADFVVQLENVRVSEISQRLGPMLRLDPQVWFESITGTSRYIVQMTEGPFKIELFLLSDDPHDRQRFERRRPARIMDQQAFLPAPEDVVITKLRWYLRGRRAKDLEDARNVVLIQGDRLDWVYLLEWGDRHGTRELLEELRRLIPIPRPEGSGLY